DARALAKPSRPAATNAIDVQRVFARIPILDMHSPALNRDMGACHPETLGATGKHTLGLITRRPDSFRNRGDALSFCGGGKLGDYVPNIRSPASPRPGRMYPFSLSWRSIAAQ